MQTDLIKLWDEYLEYKQRDRDEAPAWWSVPPDTFHDFMGWLKREKGDK